MDKKNIVWQDPLVLRRSKEKLLKQKGAVVLFTGLSGSGKTTIAHLLEERLYSLGNLTYILDGDNLRYGLNKDLGFTKEDRSENIRRVREVSNLFLNSGVITLISIIAPYKQDRQMFRNQLGEDFIEIFVDTPKEVCEQRDPKGLYKKANKGEIQNFTSIASPYEVPETPDIHIKTVEMTKEESVELIIKYLKEKHVI